MYTLNGYKIKVVKSKSKDEHNPERPLWDIVVTTPKKETTRFVGVLRYKNGWDQGQASERAKDGSSYYLESIPRGISSGNGQGISSQRTPYLTESRLELIVSLFDGSCDSGLKSEWSLYKE